MPKRTNRGNSSAIALQLKGSGIMADKPISSERFAMLVDEAGLTLTPEQFDELRQGYRFVQRMKRVVRRPRDRAAEPAHVFVHPRAGAQ